MKRFHPAAVGIVTFLVTCPFLFGGGSGDGDIPVFRSYGDRVLAGDVPYRDFHPEYPPGAFLFFVVPSLAPERRYLLIFQLIAAATLVKWYPLVLLPIGLLFVERRRRVRAFVGFCIVSLVLWLPFAVVGHGGLYNSEKGQADRHLHLDSIGSSVLLVLHRPV